MIQRMLNLFRSNDVHVRLSHTGRYIVEHGELASKVIDAIHKNKGKLQNGELVRVDGTNMSIEFTTNIEDAKTPA